MALLPNIEHNRQLARAGVPAATVPGAGASIVVAAPHVRSTVKRSIFFPSIHNVKSWSRSAAMAASEPLIETSSWASRVVTASRW